MADQKKPIFWLISAQAAVRRFGSIAAILTVLASGCKIRSEQTLASQSEPAPAIVSGLSLSDVETLLKRNPGIDTIDKLIVRLPEEYRRHYVLMYQSACQQPGSYREPRVIFFGSKPPLFMAFSGSDKNPNSQQIEALQFNDNTRSYSTGLITLRPGQKPKLQANLSGCGFCHGGSTPHPLWDAYPAWAGAYASGNYKNLEEAPAFEAQQFSNFAANASKHGRYQHLVDLPKYYSHAATMELTKTIADTSSQDIVRRMTQTKHHSSYKYAIQAALLGCSHIDEYLPTSLRRLFPERIEHFLQITPQTITTTFGERLSKRNRLAGLAGDHYLAKAINFAADEQHWKRIAALRYLLERDGKSISSWFPGILPGSYTAGFSSTVTVSLSYQHARVTGINQSISCANLQKLSLTALAGLAGKGRAALETGISSSP